MIEKRLKEILGEVLEIEAQAVGPQTSFWTLERWDSMRHVRILAAVETAFDVCLTAEEAGRLLDYEALYRFLEGARGEATGPPESARASDLRQRLTSLPLPSGGVVLVHSSLRALGSRVGGPDTVLQALMDWVDSVQGTLVMPTMTGRFLGREFDPETTPTEGMGILPELFRRRQDTHRSDHPTSSFAARGPLAGTITAPHPLDRPEGPDGPMGRLLALAARVLLLGVDHEANTAVHLAEYLEDVPYIRRLPLRVGTNPGGDRTFLGLGHCANTTFRPVGEALHRSGLSRRITLGDAEAELFTMEAAVETARSILTRDPLAFLCGSFSCSVCGEYLRARARAGNGRAAGDPPR